MIERGRRTNDPSITERIKISGSVPRSITQSKIGQRGRKRTGMRQPKETEEERGRWGGQEETRKKREGRWAR
jgi:hypothetical protein